MPPYLANLTNEKDNELPPLPPDHGFVEGDLVELPVYGNGIVSGSVKYIDIVFGNKHYKGLAIIAEDGVFYELDPRVTKKTSRKPDES
jgi:hypothetical protein